MINRIQPTMTFFRNPAVLAMALWLCSTASASPKAALVFDPHEPTVLFGVEELERFLSSCEPLVFERNPEATDSFLRRFVFKEDASMEPYSFGYTCIRRGDIIETVFNGPSPACVLHGVYTFLEDAGFRFEITGPIAPEKLNTDALIGKHRVIRPAVKNRGIRFHMNFPQDISSFTLNEARQYIRNLARMRMNYMTFHSYPGRLFNGEYDGVMHWAGRTYEEKMEITNDPVFRVIRNKRLYRIPELEAYDSLPQERARQMKRWTASVFEEVKRMGMTLHFSFEPRLQPEQTVAAMFRDICAAYPMIDVLELMTEENGGGYRESPDNRKNIEAMRSALHEGFDAVSLMEDSPIAVHLKDPEDALVKMVREIAHNLKLAQFLRRHYAQAQSMQLAVGVYCSKEGYNATASYLLDHFVPSDIKTAQMPQYGSRWVAKRIRDEFLTAPENWTRKIIYGWYEFDGLFFLQQVSCDGVHDVLKEAVGRTPGDQAYAVIFNTWASAKNRVTIRYGAVASIDGAMDTAAFYRRYAESMTLSDPELYAAAMKKIDDSEETMRQTWNIGFGMGWMWVGWWPGQMNQWFSRPHFMEQAQAAYEEALSSITRLNAESEDGRWMLAYMKKNIACSIAHYQAVRRLAPIYPLIAREGHAVNPDELTDAQRKDVLAACRDATYYSNLYMSRYAEIIAERGDEGALLNYYYCLPQFLLKIRAEYGGDKDARPLPVEETNMWIAPAKWD